MTWLDKIIMTLQMSMIFYGTKLRNMFPQTILCPAFVILFLRIVFCQFQIKFSWSMEAAKPARDVFFFWTQDFMNKGFNCPWQLLQPKSPYLTFDVFFGRFSLPANLLNNHPLLSSLLPQKVEIILSVEKIYFL